MGSNEREDDTGEPDRFGRKKLGIIHAATTLLNDEGIKGTTFQEVARLVGLNTSSITYYFRRKEQLVEAVYEATLERMAAMADEALALPTPRERVAHWVSTHVDLRNSIRRGEQGRIAVLSEMRTLPEDMLASLNERYVDLFRRIRGFFGDPANEAEKRLFTARAHILLEIVFWLPAWTPLYSSRDFPRVKAQLMNVIGDGMALPGARWSPQVLDGRDRWRTSEQGRSPQGEFLRMATVMINQRGYKGASVQSIASGLNVTKGSFYHHHEAKDDLVLQCFENSYERLSSVQLAALGMDGDGWARLTGTIAELLDLQFNDPTPLLRTAALQAVPLERRAVVLQRSERVGRRFSGMLVDAFAEGSIRIVDPLIAAQVLLATLNAAYEMRGWSQQFDDPAEAVRCYAWSFAYGMFPGLDVAG
ncbi:MAG: TetR/AcrR family transcriptional regulator [Sphingomonadales bacterium]|nr:TetR/AcrR family transcriptional regulator [Sphingomonadales bacterium]MDE2567323.1 TetR/AcrR family transcriptional regulator [Sphingomonadales bacterium]